MNIKKTFALTGMLLVVIISSVLLICQFNINNDSYLNKHNASLSEKIKENELKINNINKKIIETENEKNVNQKKLEKVKIEKENFVKSEEKEIKQIEVKHDLKPNSKDPEELLIEIIGKFLPLLAIPTIIAFVRNLIC